ncbi:MAG: DUF6142 family protein [Lachnospiraceae bacterium]|nr:DUF6142 family protein [Lachnospiraceae bacterium]
MPKPKKIKKKKSFMFTTRHYSFTGILSFALAVISILGLIFSVLIAYHNGGSVDDHYGAVGLFAVLMNITSVIAAFISLNERDTYVWVPKAALVADAVDMIAWILLVVWGS